MNLFRSEEHARNWTGFSEEASGGLLTLAQIVEIFSAEQFRERGAADYLTRYPQLRPKFIETLGRVTQGSAFWALPK